MSERTRDSADLHGTHNGTLLTVRATRNFSKSTALAPVRKIPKSTERRAAQVQVSHGRSSRASKAKKNDLLRLRIILR